MQPPRNQNSPDDDIPAIAARVKSNVRNILFASPDFPRFYTDTVLSAAPNSSVAKILAPHYKKICERSSMPNVTSCTHIKVTGVRCGSPALRGELFCYFHHHLRHNVKGPRSRMNYSAILEDEESIQVSLMEMVNALLNGTIELKRAELILRALNTAVRNIRRAKFGIDGKSMVREIPNYDEPSENQATGTDNEEAEAPAQAPAATNRPAAPAASARGTATAPDPTRPKPPASAKQPEAPKERKIAAHRASGG